jgi:transcriptional regulator with XRE-family HTH domain
VDFKDRLKILRILAGFNQEELASAAQIEQSPLAAYERGVFNPKTEVILSLADALGVSPNYLVRGTPPLSSHVWVIENPRPQTINRNQKEIARILPHFLAENEFNFGCPARLADGYAYLLGRDTVKDKEKRNSLPLIDSALECKTDRELNCLLLVNNLLEECFKKAFNAYKKIKFSGEMSLQHHTVALFDAADLDILALRGKYVKIDRVGLSNSLAQLRACKLAHGNLLVKKERLSQIIHGLIYPLVSDRLSEDTISNMATLFVKTIEELAPLSGNESNWIGIHAEIFRMMKKDEDKSD